MLLVFPNRRLPQEKSLKYSFTGSHFLIFFSPSLSLSLPPNITAERDRAILFPVLPFRLRAPPGTGEVGGFV